MYGRKALYKKKKVPVVAAKEGKPYFKVKDIKGDKNGGKRVVPLKKSVRQYVSGQPACMHVNMRECILLYQCAAAVLPHRRCPPQASFLHKAKACESTFQHHSRDCFDPARW